MSDFLQNLDGEIEKKELKLMEPKKNGVGIEAPVVVHYPHLLADSLREIAQKAYDAGASEKESREAKFKEYYKDLDVEWIGEDGNMACRATTKLGAWRKFKRLMRDDVGRFEADDMGTFEEQSERMICDGWMHMPTAEDYESDEFAWYVTWNEEKKNKYHVFVYKA